jgi:hypothetical protein
MEREMKEMRGHEGDGGEERSEGTKEGDKVSDKGQQKKNPKSLEKPEREENHVGRKKNKGYICCALCHR